MSDKFEIGEAAIYVRPGSPFYGQECTVIDIERSDDFGAGFDHTTGQMSYHGYLPYQVSVKVNGSFLWAKAEWLRKKKPPQREMDRKVAWDDCAWRPKALEGTLC